MRGQDKYRGYIPIEQIVGRQIDRILYHKTHQQWDQYEFGITGLIDILTPEDEQKALDFIKENKIEYDTNIQMRTQYEALFRFIKKLFANANIIWKKGGYNIGGGGIGFSEEIDIKYD